MSDDTVEAATNMTLEELQLLRRAFDEGRFEGVLSEHEGATQTMLFEVPDGHVGVSVCGYPGDGDVHLSVSRWRKEQHHEVEDRWVWVRSGE